MSKSRRSLSILASLLLAAVPALAQDGARVASATNAPANGSRDASQTAEEGIQPPAGYVIGPQDVLSIVVAKEPDLSVRTFVRPDGKISYPQLTEVQAAGLTPMELKAKITEGLDKFLNGPDVNVLVLEIHSNVAYVNGAVRMPGVYALGGPTTVMEMIVKAGGFSEYAKTDKVQILRNESGKHVQYTFNYKRFLEGKDYKQNIPLRIGDMILVP